jgi:general secretion pathway protein G
MKTPAARACPRRGFTLVEMLVVMAIVALLLALAMPRFAQSVDRGRETVLRHDLRAMRDAIDRYHGDRSRWPASLDELVEQRYLRAMPVDPVTDSATTWRAVPAPGGSGVHDVKSGSPAQALDGTAYADW